MQVVCDGLEELDMEMQLFLNAVFNRGFQIIPKLLFEDSSNDWYLTYDYHMRFLFRETTSS
jgi:hypothetical protein